jgi:hypothetical protein
MDYQWYIYNLKNYIIITYDCEINKKKINIDLIFDEINQISIEYKWTSKLEHNDTKLIKNINDNLVII